MDHASTLLIATSLVFTVATVFAMLGLGGGMLYVPLFKWLDLPLKTVAIPLGLLLNGVASASAMVRYAREGLVDFRGGLPAAASAFVIAPIGAWCMGYASRNALLILFAAFTALAGIYSLRASRQETLIPPPPARRFWVGLGLGGFNGFIGGLLGVGGGFLIAPMLLALGFPTKQAVGTTSFIVTFASISGFAAHALAGRLDSTLTLCTVAAAIAGAQLGAWFMTQRAKPGWLKRLYALLLLGVAAKLLWDILKL